MVLSADMVGSVPADGGSIEVTLGQLAVAEPPTVLITAALGSCVGVAILDSHTHRGGLAHIMLPSPTSKRHEVMPGRFADWAIPELVRRLQEQGSLKRRLVAKIAGGAAMFRTEGSAGGIGERNIEEVKRQLALMSIPLLSEDTGESHARTVEFVLETGEMLVRSYQFGVRRL